MNIEEAAVVNPRPHAETHIQQYLASDGAEVDHPAGDNLILLYTTGRKSGEIRRVPVGAFPEGDALLVIGSNAGGPKPPLWYLNLIANPTVWVRKQADFYEAEASVLPAEERQVFWDDLTARMPVFAEFQEKAGRELPVVRLARVNS